VEKRVNALLDQLENFVDLKMKECCIVVDQTVDAVIEALPGNVLSMDCADFEKMCSSNAEFDDKFNLPLKIVDSFNLLKLDEILKEEPVEVKMPVHEMAVQAQTEQHDMQNQYSE